MIVASNNTGNYYEIYLVLAGFLPTDMYMRFSIDDLKRVQERLGLPTEYFVYEMLSTMVRATLFTLRVSVIETNVTVYKELL